MFLASTVPQVVNTFEGVEIGPLITDLGTNLVSMIQPLIVPILGVSITLAGARIGLRYAKAFINRSA